MNHGRLIALLAFLVGLVPLLISADSVAQAATPEYRIPCKVSTNGNWKVMRDKKSMTDQQLLDDINTNGKKCARFSSY